MFFLFAPKEPPVHCTDRGLLLSLPLGQRRSGGGVEGGVGEVDVFGVHFLLAQAQAFSEALEVNDLPLPQKADDVVHVRVVGQAEDVVIGQAGLLLGGQVLGEVGDDVAGGLDGPGAPGEAGGGGGVDPGGVVHEVGGEGGVLDLILFQVPGQLVDDGGHHLHVTQFLRADCGSKRATGAGKAVFSFFCLWI